ncbi:hypothetical protein KAS08_06190 [Candidatus Pacearchaeota archaeon]|nr:hypothetical protein [Candidatus Pacearchaeota archaeon]
MVETTVRLNKETKRELDLFRQYKGESYDELIRKIIFIAKSSEMDPKSSQDDMKEIRKAREKIKTSGRYGKDEINKILGLN